MWNAIKAFFRTGEYTTEWSNGTKKRYLNGELHREDGPAVEWSTGGNEWWLNGKLHREDGPAIEWSNDDKEWWLNGEKLSEAEFNKRINKSSCDGKFVNVDGMMYKLVKV